MNPDIIEEEMKFELASKEKDFSKKIEIINSLKISCGDKKAKLESLLKKFTISNGKLMYRLRFNQIENIKNSNLFKKFNNIDIVWDNSKSHIANHVKDLINFLGAKLIHLPVKCPEYNPIELTWNDNKYQTAKEPIDDENELKNFFENEFYTAVEKNNYDSYWYNLIESKRNFYQNDLETSITI
jgi:hypothetical protein